MKGNRTAARPAAEGAPKPAPAPSSNVFRTFLRTLEKIEAPRAQAPRREGSR